MALCDFRCAACDLVFEAHRAAADWPATPPCPRCGGVTARYHGAPANTYRPFKPYFDIGLGRQIGSLADRHRACRELKMDMKDQPSAGDFSARKDWSHEKRKERARA